jgi:DNA-directed RNA polymerase subunit RPC12/RpoP
LYRTHELCRVQTEESGLEEWACPTCGRRLLLRWPPHYHKTIIEPGDEAACHIGRTGDTTGPPADLAGETASAAAPGAPDTPEAAWHRPNRRRWLRETGIEALENHGRSRLNSSEPV